jgi:hypothetical protein
VIQRGNNREPIFAAEEDYRFYLEACKRQRSRMGVPFTPMS